MRDMELKEDARDTRWARCRGCPARRPPAPTRCRRGFPDWAQSSLPQSPAPPLRRVYRTFGQGNTYQRCVLDPQAMLNDVWSVNTPLTGPNQQVANGDYYGPHTASDNASFMGYWGPAGSRDTQRPPLSRLWCATSTIVSGFYGT